MEDEEDKDVRRPSKCSACSVGNTADHQCVCGTRRSSTRPRSLTPRTRAREEGDTASRTARVLQAPRQSGAVRSRLRSRVPLLLQSPLHLLAPAPSRLLRQQASPPRQVLHREEGRRWLPHPHRLPRAPAKRSPRMSRQVRLCLWTSSRGPRTSDRV